MHLNLKRIVANLFALAYSVIVINKNYMELQAAYGRNPKTKAEAEALFRNGKDWIGDYSIGFAYCSIRDFAAGTKVLLRYKNNLQVMQVVV